MRSWKSTGSALITDLLKNNDGQTRFPVLQARGNTNNKYNGTYTHIDRQARSGQDNSKNHRRGQARERIHGRRRLHSDLDLRKHAFPGHAERLRQGTCGAEGLSAGAPALPADGQACPYRQRLDSRHQCGQTAQGHREIVTGMFPHHCRHGCFARG